MKKKIKAIRKLIVKKIKKEVIDYKDLVKADFNIDYTEYK